ncbi:hypothetical protein PHPALM_28413 [Phytophthora palmivora]|uniref:Uncharacterized protein n=1 Tax=Phytophthora palmivora TaxID=4796 RepID=A0A2P4XA50_9STRA|nr:hypothetical protein PHPALM_28413 [Phytophthora palmivora]
MIGITITDHKQRSSEFAFPKLQVLLSLTAGSSRLTRNSLGDPNYLYLNLRALFTEQWDSIARDVWNDSRPKLQHIRPLNHASIGKYLLQVREHLAKVQQDGCYLIVEPDLLNQWPEIFISTTAVVDKRGSKTTIRVINNYSFPGGVSVNDFTSTFNFPTISYNPPRDIARRIFALRKRHPGHPILMMLGDMSLTFRHIPMNADHVHMFAFRFEGFVVIDLACGFGWCGSPAFYSLAGSLINH